MWMTIRWPCSFSSLRCVQLFATPWTAARQAPLSITNSQSLLKLMSIESVMPSNHLILCRRPLLLPPSIFPSIRGFFNELVLRIRWPKYWSCSFSISPSSECSGLISFRMDWLDLLAVQGTLNSLQHHSSKASILQHSAFFMVQLSHPYMTTGKTIALTRWTFVGKVMSCLSLQWKVCQVKWISYWCTPLNQFFWPLWGSLGRVSPFIPTLFLFQRQTRLPGWRKTSKHHFH